MCSGGAFIRDKMTFIFACLVYALLLCVPCNSLNSKRQACKPVIGSNGCRCIHSAGNGIDLMVLKERSNWYKHFKWQLNLALQFFKRIIQKFVCYVKLKFSKELFQNCYNTI